MTAGSPFDLLAPDYDKTFTNSTIGRILREAVWTEFESCFLPDQHILELGCGTGEDACFLARRGVRVLAVDHSLEMVAGPGGPVDHQPAVSTDADRFRSE